MHIRYLIEHLEQNKKNFRIFFAKRTFDSWSPDADSAAFTHLGLWKTPFCVRERSTLTQTRSPHFEQHFEDFWEKSALKSLHSRHAGWMFGVNRCDQSESGLCKSTAGPRRTACLCVSKQKFLAAVYWEDGLIQSICGAQPFPPAPQLEALALDSWNRFN